MRHQPITTLLALLMSGMLLSGCTLLAGGVAGGVTATELEEEDDQIDPLEQTEIGEEVYE